MKKAFVVIGNLSIGGAERLAVDEVNEMHRRGVDVSLITLLPEEHASFLSSCTLPEKNKICVPFRSLFDLMAWWRLMFVLRREKPHAVITHLWFANTIGRIAARVVGIRCVVSFEHNVYDQVKTQKQFLVDRLLQPLSSRIVAVSDAVRDSLIAHGVAPSKIAVIYNGIDLSRYQRARPVDVRSREKLPHGPIFLFVGRLIEQKGVDVLLESFSRVPEGALLIAGTGPDSQKLESQSQSLGIAPRTRFLGIRSDIPELMRSADVLVLPSRWEGQGLVVPEAFAAGLPVIISDFPAGTQLVRNNENGLIVPREDPTALVGAMRRMSDRSLRNSLAANARASASRFSIERHVDKLLSYAV